MTTDGPAIVPVPPDSSGTPSLRSRAMTASIYRTAVYVADRAVSMLANIVLARFLAPEAFGLVALAGVLYQGLSMFAEIGIGPAIVSHKDAGDAKFLNTAWTMQVIRGLVLFVIASVLCLPAAGFYEQPLLVWLLPAVAINAAVSGFNSTAIFTTNRNLQEGRRASLELCQGLVQRGVMVALASVWPSPWVIVIGLGLGVILNVIASHTLLPGIRNWFHWDSDSARQLFAFGRWVSLGTIIAFFGQQLDRLMMGKLISVETVGVYGIALTVARLPQEFAGVLTHHVMFPLMAELARGDMKRFRERLRYVRGFLLTLGVAATLGVVLLSPWFFRLAYKPDFADAIWMAPLAALTGWILLLESTASRALLAIGASKSLAVQSFVQVIFTAGACWIGLDYQGGAKGFILGTAAGALAGHIVLLTALRRRGLGVESQDLRFSVLLGALAAAGLGVPYLVGRSFGDDAARAASIGVTAVLLISTSAWAIRTARRVLLNQR